MKEPTAVLKYARYIVCKVMSNSGCNIISGNMFRLNVNEMNTTLSCDLGTVMFSLCLTGTW